MTAVSFIALMAVAGCSDVIIQDDEAAGGAGGEGASDGSGGGGGQGGQGGEGGDGCPGPFTPTCDPGDTLLDGPGPCPSDTLCYAETICGITFTCVDSFPEHGCPAEAPIAGDLCDLADVMQCTYLYEDAACEVFECAPVYPEEGAPSEWVLVANMCPTSGA
jgi:hypothetical protein